MKPSPLSSRTGMILALALFLVPFGSGTAAGDASPGAAYECEPNLIEVMFEWNAKVRLRDGALKDLGPAPLPGVHAVLDPALDPQWSRLCDVPEETLDDLQRNGELRSAARVYNLNNIYRVRIAHGHDPWKIARDLEALPGVMSARPVPRPTPPPTPPNYVPNQGYLRPAAASPTGIDADYAWTQPGGDGTGVTVVDLEYGWFPHDDVSQLSLPGVELNPNTLWLPTGATDDHGTAVAGQLASDPNGWGTTGIVYGATLKTCGTYYGTSSPGWNVAGAIAYAVAAMSAGDVLLLEQQWDYFGNADHVPIEWWTDYAPHPQSYNAVYAAIVNAVANGIHVVEAGGNSRLTSTGIDTDTMTWQGDTGAIIVGAGGAYAGGTYPGGDLERLFFSAYGSRFNLQGWGEDVVTTGYGTLYNAEGKPRWYTGTFSGTSSASPIVAGAVAACSGYWTANVSSTPLNPGTMRALLVNTGTPQAFGLPGHIGPRPDLSTAFAAMTTMWTDVTTGPLGDPTMGYGVGWTDIDADADPDLFVANSGGNQLLRNDRPGYTDITGGLLGTGVTEGIAWGDYDNDGDPDLFMANYNGPNELHRNEGSGAFVNVTPPSIGVVGPSMSPAWADYDNDGDLDLYVANYGTANQLLRNDGNDQFTDVSAPPVADPGWSAGVAWGDFDDDGDPDLYVANYGSANRLFRNDGGGTFVDATPPPLNDAGFALGVAWGDYDNDDDLDLYVGNVLATNRLFRNDGGSVFVDVAVGTPLADPGYASGLAWGDSDNDGLIDLYLADSNGPNHLFRNQGAGSFMDVTPAVLGYAGYSQGVGWADHDGDGDLDLFVSNLDGPNRLYQNGSGSNLNWLDVELVGLVSNAQGIGARVRVEIGSSSQMREISASSGYLSQNDVVAHFGLGAAGTVDRVEVLWPSGVVQDTLVVSANQRIVIVESAPGLDVPDVAPVAWTYRLEPTAPNPFRESTTIAYQVADPGRIRLTVFDVTGRRVRTLVDEMATTPGRRLAVWDGRDDAGRRAASGVYFYRIEAGRYRDARRTILMR